MEKKNLNGGDIFRSLIDGGLNGLLNTISQLEKSGVKKKSFVFVVGPDGVVEMKDFGKPKQQDKKFETCPDCHGDGYLVCEECAGDGYTVERARLGEKNTVHVCPECGGTGDIICDTCKGSGKIESNTPEDTTEADVAKDLMDGAIRNVFLHHTHQTIIGPVNIKVEKIQHGENGVYVIPRIEQGVLIPDDNFDQELDVVRKQFNVEIDIPTVFYRK